VHAKLIYKRLSLPMAAGASRQPSARWPATIDRRRKEHCALREAAGSIFLSLPVDIHWST